MRDPNLLNSWKEIARYMGRAVRTLQRWEEECQLPIHRPRGRKRSAVFALPTELDAWLRDCPVQAERGNSGQEVSGAPVSGAPWLRQRGFRP
jgi:phage terminase Nu1 subunit (DNA packaging protein)